MAASPRTVGASTVDQDPGFFIHIADPTFFEAPWPGERRSGPYPTVGEAVAQAASDVASGAYSLDGFVGVFDDKASLRHDEKKGSAASKVPVARVEAAAAEIVLEQASDRARTLADAWEALRQVLPAGMTVAAYLKRAGMELNG